MTASVVSVAHVPTAGPGGGAQGAAASSSAVAGFEALLAALFGDQGQTTQAGFPNLIAAATPGIKAAQTGQPGATADSGDKDQKDPSEDPTTGDPTAGALTG